MAQTVEQLVPREDLIVEEIDGECLVLDMERNVYFGLDQIGLFVWRSLEARSTREQIFDALISHYGEENREQITADVGQFLDHLLKEGLIYRKATGSSPEREGVRGLDTPRAGGRELTTALDTRGFLRDQIAP